MGLIKRGRFWWYRFRFEKQLIQESTKTEDKVLAKRAEANRRKELVEGLIGGDTRAGRSQLIKEVSDRYLRNYKAHHASSGCAEYGCKHLRRLLGSKTVGEVNVNLITDYQTTRKEEGAAGATINNEVSLLLRFLEERGDALRGELRRKRKMKLPTNEEVGKAYTIAEQDRLLKAAQESSNPYIEFALRLALNGGMRSKEIRMLTWSQIDFVKNMLTVGKSKTKASSYRAVPLNDDLLPAFLKHREWYVKRFKELKPDWYVFPYTRHRRMDPTRPIVTLQSQWVKIREAAGVKGRFHDMRHTVVSQLGESGASSTTIMASVGHVSRRMLEKYSHPNIEAQRRAFEQMVEYRNQQREREAAAAQQFEQKPEKPATVN
jgi:integrase